MKFEKKYGSFEELFYIVSTNFCNKLVTEVCATYVKGFHVKVILPLTTNNREFIVTEHCASFLVC